MNQIILNVGSTEIAFSKVNSAADSFKQSLKHELHTALEMLFKDPDLSPEKRTAVLNELIARVWKGLAKDQRKELGGLLDNFGKGALDQDDLERMLTTLAVDPMGVRLPTVDRKPLPKSPRQPSGGQATETMGFEAIYEQLKAAETMLERRKDLVEELGIRQCNDMPQGENRNRLMALLIRHRERTLNPKDAKMLAWFLGIPEDQLAPQMQRAG